jgi:arylsulfatase A-like enzyme
MRFEDAWSMPLCSPTRAALQTGRYPRRTGYGGNDGDVGSSDVELDPNLVTLAEVVELSPYATYATSYVGKWHLAGWLSESSGLAPIVQGWDWWSGAMANLGAWVGGGRPGDAGYFHWQKIDTTGAMVETSAYATSDNVDDAIARVSAMPEPWLMQISFNAPHAPWDLPPADLHTDTDLTQQSSRTDLQRAMVEAIDTEMGRLFDSMPPDVLDRTTVFFLGDNGTPSGLLRYDGLDSDRSKGTLFDGGVRVPFVVAGPLVGSPGSTTETLASVVDVYATVADIAGVNTEQVGGALAPAAPVVLDGYSLLSTLADPTVSTAHKLVVNEVCERVSFFEYVDGAPDEGPDLLLDGGVLTDEQQAAFDRLSAELDTLVSGLTYDAASWPESDAVPGCEGGDMVDTGP